MYLLAMSGEDLKLQVDLTVDKLLHVGRETQIRLPKTQEILQVRIEEEIEPKIWRGVTNTRGINEEVIMRYSRTDNRELFVHKEWLGTCG